MFRRIALLGLMATLAASVWAQGPPRLGKQFYIAFMRPAKGPLNPEDPKVRPVLMKHLEMIQKLEKSGQLFMAGPLRDENDPQAWDGSGMIILRAKSIEEARAVFEKDPMVVAGLRTAEITGWMLNEGSLTTTIQFSEEKVKIE